MITAVKGHICARELKLKGFSLAEMSVVLVIVGFIASSAISVAITSDYQTKKDETEEKMLRIDEALAGYVAINHRLPCPADGTIALTNANFGVESNNGAVPPVCNKNFIDNTANVFGGVVPVATLQLPNDFMFDGWGRRIDYIVDYRFAIADITIGATCSGTPDNPCFRDMTAGTITIRDQSGAARTTQAVYVLLSHGENGHGAFTKNGSGTRINGFPPGNPYRNAAASADEFTNAKFDNTGANTAYIANFVMRDYIRVDDGSASGSANRIYFDDILHFKSKEQIVTDAGAYAYDPTCKKALDVINNSGTSSDSCNLASDSTQCETFASEIYLRCLQ